MSQFNFILFYNPTPYNSLTSQEHHPPLSSPYFPLINWFHKASLLFANHQFHLQRRVLLSVKRHLTPKPLFFLLKHTNSHLTKWGSRSKFPPPWRKSLWICSSLCLTELGMHNKDINPLQGCVFGYPLYMSYITWFIASLFTYKIYPFICQKECVCVCVGGWVEGCCSWWGREWLSFGCPLPFELCLWVPFLYVLYTLMYSILVYL